MDKGTDSRRGGNGYSGFNNDRLKSPDAIIDLVTIPADGVISGLDSVILIGDQGPATGKHLQMVDRKTSILCLGAKANQEKP